jgi:hypothetical protein
MRTLVACLFLAPIAWVNVVRNLPRTVGEQSNETCDATLALTVWGVIGIVTTAVLYMNWETL